MILLTEILTQNISIRKQIFYPVHRDIEQFVTHYEGHLEHIEVEKSWPTDYASTSSLSRLQWLGTG